MVDNEELPPEFVKNKLHLQKIMFVCAVARPHYLPETGTYWDGKIGMWVFAAMVPAGRDSINCKKGTPVFTTTNVTKPVFRKYIITKSSFGYSSEVALEV